MRLTLPFLVLLLTPTMAFAGPAIVAGPDGLTYRYVRGDPHHRRESAQDRYDRLENEMRDIEQRELKKYEDARNKDQLAKDLEAIIDKKNEALLRQLKPEAFASPEEKPEPSPFGTVGGIGSVGGIGNTGNSPKKPE